MWVTVITFSNKRYIPVLKAEKKAGGGEERSCSWLAGLAADH